MIATRFQRRIGRIALHSRHGKQVLLDIQEKRSCPNRHQSLKIGFNNVFGYYLEVRNTFKDKVPADWIRKQTLAQAERYIIPELKEYEAKILGADEKILALEARLFNELVQDMQEFIPQIQINANLVARLDLPVGIRKHSRRKQVRAPHGRRQYGD